MLLSICEHRAMPVISGLAKGGVEVEQGYLALTEAHTAKHALGTADPLGLALVSTQGAANPSPHRRSPRGD